MTRELLKELDKQPSSPDLDELREKFRIVKVRPCQGAPLLPHRISVTECARFLSEKCFWLQVPCCTVRRIGPICAVFTLHRIVGLTKC